MCAATVLSLLSVCCYGTVCTVRVLLQYCPYCPCAATVLSLLSVCCYVLSVLSVCCYSTVLTVRVLLRYCLYCPCAATVLSVCCYSIRTDPICMTTYNSEVNGLTYESLDNHCYPNIRPYNLKK